jgi:predicted TIM-barrel fold metal-dependent hydrolase
LKLKKEITVHGVVHQTPQFVVPKKSCDCHTHVFGPHDQFPLSKDRKYTPPEASIENLLALHDPLGLERVVIVHPSPYGSDNSCTLDAIRRLGERARGVVVIDKGTTAMEIQKMHDLGVRGVRINLETQGVTDKKYATKEISWVYEKIKDLGWHIQLFTQLKVLSDLESVFKQFDIEFVVDHFGLINPALGMSQPYLDSVISMIKSGKLWIKLSAPHRISSKPDGEDVTELARALIEANPSRVVWGSDWPHPGGQIGQPRSIDRPEAFNPIDDGAALNRLYKWVSDKWILEKILVHNPEKLYEF